MKKTLILATVAGFLAWAITIIVLKVGNLSATIPFALWPVFAAWATYFFLGANNTGARRGAIQMACGILLSWIEMRIYVALGLSDPNFIWLGLIVFFLAWILVAISGLHVEFSACPAGFVGAAIFFGMMAGNPKLSFEELTIGSLVPAGIGFCMGLLTMWFNGMFQPKAVPEAKTTGGKAAAA
jgi:hypothetical protein